MIARRGVSSALGKYCSPVLILLHSLGLPVQAAEEKTGTDSERILIVGIPGHEQTVWEELLRKNNIAYRYDRKTHTFYVREDPLPILKRAGTVKDLATTVKRGLLERKLEAQVRGEFPKVEDPRVCLAFPLEAIGPVEEDAEPVALVLAGGLEAAEMRELKELVSDEVKGLPLRNVMVLGRKWRPWPPYGGEIPMRTPRGSVAITKTVRAEP
jgi:hypothetical protein